MDDLQKQEIATILSSLSSLSKNDLILEESTPSSIQELLLNKLFSNNIHSNYERLNVLCAVSYNAYIKNKWKRKIITIISNQTWLKSNYIEKLNACFKNIPECKNEIINLYVLIIKQEYIKEHRRCVLFNNNTLNTCCCGLPDCCVVQLFDNINKFKLEELL